MYVVHFFHIQYFQLMLTTTHQPTIDTTQHLGRKIRLTDLATLHSPVCIEDVKIWMDSNKLKINNDKTELIFS